MRSMSIGMRSPWTTLLFASCCLQFASGLTAARDSAQSSVALSESYAPTYVDCPSDVQWTRLAMGLSHSEAQWVHSRKQVVLHAVEGYLERLNLSDFKVDKYIAQIQASNLSAIPILGFAVSGGGFASAYTGSGGMRALDSRLEAANVQRTGGLLQSLMYMSGQSGGSWPITSLATHNFPTFDQLLPLWRTYVDFIQPPNGTKDVPTTTTIIGDLKAKQRTGFNVSQPDWIGRVYGYEFLPGPYGGVNTTFSGIADLSNFANHQMPFPILEMLSLADSDQEFYGLQVPRVNDTVFEVNPFEFGSWNGTVNSFMPTEWLGTQLLNSTVVNSSACVRGFDKASFMMGCAAGAFNYWYIEDLSNNTLAPFPKRSNDFTKRVLFPISILQEWVAAFKQYLNDNLQELAYGVIPNSFLGLSSTKTPDADLRMVDATESGTALPLWGQVQPARNVDFIMVWDDNEDATPYLWNNGTNLYGIYQWAEQTKTPFPLIPKTATMMNRNYTIRPTFFGCNANLTTTNSTASPILLYLANAPYTAYTNYSWTQPDTTTSQMHDIFLNSFNLMTQGNGTLDSEWPECLGCAAIDRSLEKLGIARTKQCESCFAKYCWDGIEDDEDSKVIDPLLILPPHESFSEWVKNHNF